MIRTPQQNIQLHTICNKLSIDADHKHELVYQFSDGRTESSRQLYDDECRQLIHFLQSKINASPNQVKADRMRKKIISFFIKQGYTLESGKVDMNRVYAWVLKYGYLHQPLNQYTHLQLPALVTQAEKAYNSFLDSI